MRISELSRRSGVAVPSIKFYIREGLLPPGEHTSKNQALYSEEHLELLDLIRTLKDDLGMSVATIASVLAGDRARGREFLQDGLTAVAAGAASQKSAVQRDGDEYRRALAMVRKVAEQMGWHCSRDDRPVEDAAVAVATILRVWPFELPDGVLWPYADAARALAEVEIPDDWNPDANSISAFKYAVLGTYLFEPVLLALRRIAHADRSARLIQKRQGEGKTASRKAGSRAPPRTAKPPSGRRGERRS